MTDEDKLKEEIEKLREKLNQQDKEAPLTKEEMLKISQKLDELINHYYE